MQVISIEDVPEELAEYARKRTYKIEVSNLDKRVRALRDIFEAPKTNLIYARNMAIRLRDKCVTAGRGDLANEVSYIMYNPIYAEKRKSNKEAIEATKRRFQQCLDRDQ